MNTLKRTFIAAAHDHRHQRVVCINEASEIVWSYYTPDSLPLDIQLLDHGGCLINTAKYNVEIDVNGQELWRYRLDEEELMSCRRLSNGNTLTGDLRSRSIYEQTTDYQKVWEMRFPHDNEEDVHELFRMVRPLRSGNLLVAWHKKHKIAEFSKEGVLIWEQELEAGPYEGIELPNGNYMVSVGPAGTIVEVSKTEGIVWDFRMDQVAGLKSGWIAGISVQENGHVIFSDSKWDRIIEVNRAGKVVGMFHKPELLLHPASLVIV